MPCSGHDRKKLCKEKVPFSKTNISLLANFGCFFGGEKRIFGPKKHSSAKRKIGCFSVISARTGSVVIVGHFFDGWDGSTKFRCRQSKIKGTYYSEEGMACNGQKQGWAPKNDPFYPMPDQKTMQTSCLGGFTLKSPCCNFDKSMLQQLDLENPMYQFWQGK